MLIVLVIVLLHIKHPNQFFHLHSLLQNSSPLASNSSSDFSSSIKNSEVPRDTAGNDAKTHISDKSSPAEVNVKTQGATSLKLEPATKKWVPTRQKIVISPREKSFSPPSFTISRRSAHTRNFFRIPRPSPALSHESDLGSDSELSSDDGESAEWEEEKSSRVGSAAPRRFFKYSTFRCSFAVSIF